MGRTGFGRYLVPIGIAVGFALILTSCFGDDEGDTTTTTGAAAPQTTAASPPPPDPVTPTTAAPPPPPETIVTPTTAAPPPPPPTVPATTQAPPPPTTRGPGEILIYTVQPGDTLFSIATQFGVTVDEIAELNNIADPNVIFVEDQLSIPPPG